MEKSMVDILRQYDWVNEDALMVRSPGRVNIIGEHTDYNEGFVLPAAIDKAVYMAIKPREDGRIRLTAHDLGKTYETTIDQLHPDESRGWANYLVGSVAQVQKQGVAIKGFDAVFTSTVPIGSGVSSSAALECATVFAMNQMLGAGFEKIRMVKMAQKAEHEYAGVMCGIMDQFASMMGKKDHVIRLDCKTLDFDWVPLDLKDHRILLLNTNVKHSLASSAYNTRRQECEQAVAWVQEHHAQVRSLRDVNLDMLDAYVAPKNALVDQRARFVVQEIERLNSACSFLQQGDLQGLGQKMFQTHYGLSKMYEVSCAELDYLVEQVEGNGDVLGARMMGGGFGGCTINIVKANAIEELVASIQPGYEQKFNLPLSWFVAEVADGTSLVS
ncbi:MAG TPA: galactokinase [Phnomibacter sp.]|nr:galactokinase [Phnomibacter sp.]